MTLKRLARLLVASALFITTTAFAIQAQSKPGRNPNQPIDEEYTKKIREYTTETFFNSPLTDYLPASPNVPTPKAVLGDVAGAPGKLPYAEEVYRYMRMLEKASPRVRVFSIGTTEEGREMIAAAGLRRQLLHRFPFSVIYSIEPDVILVISIAHHARRPGYWHSRVVR